MQAISKQSRVLQSLASKQSNYISYFTSQGFWKYSSSLREADRKKLFSSPRYVLSSTVKLGFWSKTCGFSTLSEHHFGIDATSIFFIKSFPFLCFTMISTKQHKTEYMNYYAENRNAKKKCENFNFLNDFPNWIGKCKTINEVI